jgi:hypothetical protein
MSTAGQIDLTRESKSTNNKINLYPTMTKDTAADSALTNGGAEDQNDDKNPADVVAASAESREDVESRHRKELKQLDGEKRAALKKAKGTKGKKAKEELTRYVSKSLSECELSEKERESVIMVVYECSACDFQ